MARHVLYPTTMKQLILLPAALLFALSGCAADDLGSTQLGVRSCFDTGDGIVCISGNDDVGTVDVNGDGTDDVFVCANAHSDSDSDVDGDVSSNEDGDVVSEESVSDSESGSDSDEACGPSFDEDGESDSDSISDLEGDGDGDGIPDEIDCDCI